MGKKKKETPCYWVHNCDCLYDCNDCPADDYDKKMTLKKAIKFFRKYGFDVSHNINLAFK